MTQNLDGRLRQLTGAVRGERLLRIRQTAASVDPVGSLIQHAVGTVPHYADIAMDRQRLHIQDLPLLRREDVAADPARFRSRLFTTDELVEMTTSGTTGIPVRVARDRASFYMLAYKTYRDVFDRIPELKGGLQPGCCAVTVINDNPHRSGQLFINPSLDYALVQRLVLNRDPETDAYAVTTAIDNNAPLLYGRPRSLLRFAELYLQLRQDRLYRPQTVLCSGDNLYPEDRHTLEAVFEAPVYNAYMSQEGGFIALDCPLRHGLHVLAERALVEVLVAPFPSPLAEGEGELVISNLENWAMPLLRYRTGDRGKVVHNTCACGFAGMTIAHLDGRDSTYFVVSSGRLNPSVLNPIFESLPIKQFQLVQDTTTSFTVRFVPRSAGDDVDAIRRMLDVALREELGSVTLYSLATDAIGEPSQKVQRYVRNLEVETSPVASAARMLPGRATGG